MKLVRHAGASRRKPYARGGHHDPCHRDGADEFERFDRIGPVERAHYVHPLETFIGLNLFLVLIPLLSLLLGSFNVVTVGLGFVIYTQLNVLNHCRVELPYFPFKTINWITAKHAVHHENMHKGNYASITLLFDKIFGTLD